MAAGVKGCVRARVGPTFGEDPTAFVLSKDNRRHNTKSQRAMRLAMICPEPEKGGRGKKSFVTKEFSEGALSKARTVTRRLDLEGSGYHRRHALVGQGIRRGQEG